jgi:hypothetical protein
MIFTAIFTPIVAPVTIVIAVRSSRGHQEPGAQYGPEQQSR